MGALRVWRFYRRGGPTMKTSCGLFVGMFLCLPYFSTAKAIDLIGQTRERFADGEFYSVKRLQDSKDYSDYARQMRLCKDAKVLARIEDIVYERVMSFDPLWIFSADMVSRPDEWLFDRGLCLNLVFASCCRVSNLSDERIFGIASKIGEIKLSPKKKWTEEELALTTVAQRREFRNRRVVVNNGLRSYRGRLLSVLRDVTRERIKGLSDEELTAYTNKLFVTARLSETDWIGYLDENIESRLTYLWLKKCESEPLRRYDFVHDRTLTWETPDFDGEEKDILRTRFLSENFKRPLSPSESDKLIDRYEKLKGYALKEAEILKVRQIPEENRFKLLKRWVNLIEEESRLRKIPPQDLNSDYEKLRILVKRKSSDASA